LKVIQLNHSDINGGAARAAYRIHHSLREADVDSQMWVDTASSGDWTVQGPPTKVKKALAKVRPILGGLVFKPFFNTGNPVIHSPALLPSGRVRALNDSDADVLHLHWVQGEMLSVADIGHLRKPVVWTLHDMWVFCGAEHYTEDYRWRDGYVKGNRPAYESGFDLNRWTWQRKRKHWQRPMHIVTPSRWLAQCVRESALMRDWPVSVVSNCLDTNKWKPLDKGLARSLLGLPKDAPLLLFGAMGGGNDPRKGFDLLLKALQHLRGELNELELVVFGQLAPKEPPDLGFPIHYTGHLHDDLSLRALYSAADVMLIPSRQDNLPNTGVESLACGTPVVAFDICGLPDIVQHQHTGYLAKPFDTEDLAGGIQWVLADSDRYNTLSQQARAFAVKHFSNAVVAEQYRAVYDAAIKAQN
jgi:glycosyltransferase involved in cell wall biosynthesis